MKTQSRKKANKLKRGKAQAPKSLLVSVLNLNVWGSVPVSGSMKTKVNPYHFRRSVDNNFYSL